MRRRLVLAAIALLALASCTKGSAGSSGGFGEKRWTVSFTMPPGWEVEKVQDFDAPPMLSVSLFDPAFKRPGDKVMDEKSKVKITLWKVDPSSARGKAMAQHGSMAGIVVNAAHDGLTDVLPRHRAAFTPTTIAGIAMMRGPSEAHMGPMHVGIERALGFDGDTWVEIDARWEQGNAPASKSAKDALNTVLATLAIRKL
jgi:hypothetical protein